MTLYLECSASGTEDTESQPMPTHPKGTVYAAIEWGTDTSITMAGLSGHSLLTAFYINPF